MLTSLTSRGWRRAGMRYFLCSFLSLGVNFSSNPQTLSKYSSMSSNNHQKQDLSHRSCYNHIYYTHKQARITWSVVEKQLTAIGLTVWVQIEWTGVGANFDLCGETFVQFDLGIDLFCVCISVCRPHPPSPSRSQGAPRAGCLGNLL